jgi:hypothetical protein
MDDDSISSGHIKCKDLTQNPFRSLKPIAALGLSVSQRTPTRDIALHTCTPAMNDADCAEVGLQALFKVFRDDAWDFFGKKRMKINEVLDGNDDRFAKGRVG